MPVTTKLINGRHRIVEADTGNIVNNRHGTPVDGKGHYSAERAARQANAINASIENRKEKP